MLEPIDLMVLLDLGVHLFWTLPPRLESIYFISNLECQSTLPNIWISKESLHLALKPCLSLKTILPMSYTAMIFNMFL